MVCELLLDTAVMYQKEGLRLDQHLSWGESLGC